MASATDPRISQLDATPSVVKWTQVVELGYSDDGSTRNSACVCFHCGKNPGDEEKLLKCARCTVASYCQKSCQIADWKQGGHKKACSSYARVGPHMSKMENNDELKAQARQDIFTRLRYYACPYAVHKARTLGRGFLFIQSTQPLATMSLEKPQDSFGRVITKPRSVLMHYLTIGEYDAEVCRDDFEMALVRDKLLQAVNEYEEETQVILLMRFRDGHLAVGVAPLVPEFAVCKSLGKEYYQDVTAASVELRLDDL